MAAIPGRCNTGPSGLPDRACCEQCSPEQIIFHDQRIGRVKNAADIQHHLVPHQSTSVDAEGDDRGWNGTVGHANCGVSRFGLDWLSSSRTTKFLTMAAMRGRASASG